MRTSLLALGIALVLSFGSMFSPSTSVAQEPPRDCTAGTGFYDECVFKAESGDMYSGFLGLFLSANASFFGASIGNVTSVSGSCDCGVKGSTENNKPLQDTKEVKCLGSGGGFEALLVGKVAGNPNNPQTLNTKGQMHLFANAFNSSGPPSSGWLYECKGAQ